MQIKVNDKIVYELTDTQKLVIQNDIPSEIFDEDMERRAGYIIKHKYERCFERLKKEWEPKLKLERSSLPTDDDAFSQIVFAHPDYKSRSIRDEEARLLEEARRNNGNK